MPRKYEFHPLANIFDLLEGEEFDALVDDMKVNGQLVPIAIYESNIIDGRNRYRACERLGIEPWTTNYDAKKSAAALVNSFNNIRRHESERKRQFTALALAKAFEKERRARSAGKGKSEIAAIFEDLVAKHIKAPEQPKNKSAKLAHDANKVSKKPLKSTEVAAASLGVQPRSVERLKRIIDKGAPEVVRAVKQDRVSLGRAEKIAALPEVEQPAALKAELAAPRKKAVAAPKTLRCPDPTCPCRCYAGESG